MMLIVPTITSRKAVNTTRPAPITWNSFPRCGHVVRPRSAGNESRPARGDSIPRILTSPCRFRGFLFVVRVKRRKAPLGSRRPDEVLVCPVQRGGRDGGRLARGDEGGDGPLGRVRQGGGGEGRVHRRRGAPGEHR